jgi:hypothetical protein
VNDVKFGTWTVPESPITIEYSLIVIEEIRHEVAEGFQRLSRGGIEVGAVLYGTRDGRTVRVLAIRPIACEHARGPGFLFSDKDRIALNEQLARDKDDPQLEGLISVGWFLSHTRSEITLTESDLEIYSIFFPAPWQVTLVIRPGRGGSMRAGFFVREADGTVKSERSYLEFNFPDRLAGVLERAQERGPRERGGRRAPAIQRSETGLVVATAGTAAPETAVVDVPTFGQPVAQTATPVRPQRRKFLLLGAWAAVVIVVAVLALRYWMVSTTIEPLALAVVEREGVLQVEWNPAAKPVANAARGSLEIMDGPETRTVALTRPELTGGHATWMRKSGDVQVRMTVENAEGKRVQEATRFLGRPPATAAEAAASGEELSTLKARRDALQTEVERLRGENNSQAARIQQLERTLRILQTRLGIVDQGKQ